MNINYVTLVLDNKEKQGEFFQLALENQLYKTSDNPLFQSRMLNVYKNCRKSDSLTVVLAFDKSNPVALVMCEDDKEVIALNKVKEKRTSGFKIIKESPLTLLRAGFLSFYVKPEYRGQCISSVLMQKVEQSRIERLDIDSSHTFLAFNAMEKACDIVKKHAKYSYPLEINKGSYNEPFEVNQLYEFLFELDAEEKISRNRNKYLDKQTLSQYNNTIKVTP